MRFNIRCLGVLAACLALVFGVAHAQVNITTWNYDNSRTGANTEETILTPNNLNFTTFGKLFSVDVDGFIYAEPLYLSGVHINGGTHNVVYIATEHDSVYAIDADSGAVYWQKNLIVAGGTTFDSKTVQNCSDGSGEIGITGTPVIDTTTGTLYVVAKSVANGVYYQYLHALDTLTGTEKFGGPTSIVGSAIGKASDSVNGTVAFDVKALNNRSALLLEGGHVVIAYSILCDRKPWHGWVMSYNAGTMQQEAVYNTSPNGVGNGIWMTAGGIAADSDGNMYFSTGNGTWNGTTDLGESLIKLGPVSSGMKLLDYFTAWNQNTLTNEDADLSAGGVVLLPKLANGKSLIHTIGKDGKIYLMDTANLGKYCITETPACSDTNTNIVQEVPGAFSGMWGTPALWNNRIYWTGGNLSSGAAEGVKAFSFNAGGSGLISTSAVSVSNEKYKYPGPSPTVSANGNTNGIVWGLDNSNRGKTCTNNTNCQTLVAYDATDLTKLLYTSNQAANGRDLPGNAAKWAVPVVANGKVYAGTGGRLSVYGLLSSTPVAATPTFTLAAGTYTSTQTVSIDDGTSGAALYYTTDGSMPTAASAKYTVALKISTTTTLKAVAVAGGYTNSAVAAATYTIQAVSSGGSAATVQVSLGSAANVYAIGSEGVASNGHGIDDVADTYSATLLGRTLVWNGITFALGSASVADAASSTTLSLPPGKYTTLNLLATAVNGNQQAQTFTVNYTDGTTTTLTQSLSDWHTPQSFMGESVALSMAYRLLPTGARNAGVFDLYGYSFAINSSKTVKSLTLPNNKKVVVLAVDLTPASNIGASVDLSAAANVAAIFTDGTAPTGGGIDNYGNSYATSTIASGTVSWNGENFLLPRSNGNGAVSNTTVSVTAGTYSGIDMLAIGVNGAQLNQVFTLTYTDGTTSTVRQSLSDWAVSSKYAGESLALATAYRVTPNGTTSSLHGPFNLYGYTIPANSAKTLQSITLPKNRNVVVLAMVPVSTAVQLVALDSLVNVSSIFTDGTPVTKGGIDTWSNAYSASTLNAGMITWNGAQFRFSGSYNGPNGVANGMIPLTAGHYSTLSFLGTAILGNRPSQTFVIAYTDGSTANITQSMSDWHTPQHYSGEACVISAQYRVTSPGALTAASAGPFCLYVYNLPLDSSKTVKSVTLPATRNVVILSVMLRP